MILKHFLSKNTCNTIQYNTIQYNGRVYTAHLEIPQHVSEKTPFMQFLHLQHSKRGVLLTIETVETSVCVKHITGVGEG